MSLTLQQIITEAGLLVVSGVQTADQVTALNNFNTDFFNVVKIPAIERFTSGSAATYTLASSVREKNIDLVEVGMLKYRNLNRDAVNPTDNNFSFDDTTHILTLSPAPYQSGLPGVVRHRRIATTTFTTGNLNATPDIPDEYQYSLIPALASFLAAEQDDMVRAGNYEAQYKAAWNVAAQNYQVNA